MLAENLFWFGTLRYIVKGFFGKLFRVICPLSVFMCSKKSFESVKLLMEFGALENSPNLKVILC